MTLPRNVQLSTDQRTNTIHENRPPHCNIATLQFEPKPACSPLIQPMRSRNRSPPKRLSSCSQCAYAKVNMSRTWRPIRLPFPILCQCLARSRHVSLPQDSLTEVTYCLNRAVVRCCIKASWTVVVGQETRQVSSSAADVEQARNGLCQRPKTRVLGPMSRAFSHSTICFQGITSTHPTLPFHHLPTSLPLR